MTLDNWIVIHQCLISSNFLSTAYVFGQMRHPSSVPSLITVLSDSNEAGMVRHEAAEALGSIATPECLPVLKRFSTDEERVVRESCIVALDMYEYENGESF